VARGPRARRPCTFAATGDCTLDDSGINGLPEGEPPSQKPLLCLGIGLRRRVRHKLAERVGLSPTATKPFKINGLERRISQRVYHTRVPKASVFLRAYWRANEISTAPMGSRMTASARRRRQTQCGRLWRAWLRNEPRDVLERVDLQRRPGQGAARIGLTSTHGGVIKIG